MSHLYDLYVGSSRRFSAHASRAESWPEILHDSKLQHVHGEWNGTLEETLQITAELANDDAAFRVAYALQVITGNDSILVTRLATPSDDSPMNSMRRFRAETVTKESGNRTILGVGEHLVGFAYQPSVTGAYVAALVHFDTSVTPVS